MYQSKYVRSVQSQCSDLLFFLIIKLVSGGICIQVMYLTVSKSKEYHSVEIHCNNLSNSLHSKCYSIKKVPEVKVPFMQIGSFHISEYYSILLTVDALSHSSIIFAAQLILTSYILF